MRIRRTELHTPTTRLDAITLGIGAGFGLCWIMMGRDIRELTAVLEKNAQRAATPMQPETKDAPLLTGGMI